MRKEKTALRNGLILVATIAALVVITVFLVRTLAGAP